MAKRGPIISAFCKPLAPVVLLTKAYFATSSRTAPLAATTRPISLDSFRNAWQLDREGQAALRFIVKWHNELSPKERENAPDMKTLLAIAGRLPQTREDLARIKGVSRWFANEHGKRFVGELMRATATADDASFVPIDPPPYATFEEIRLDGWLAQMRSELSIELEIAPELAFPSRLLKRMRALAVETGDPTRAGEALEGWRKELLGPAFAQFSQEKAEVGTT